MSGRMGRLRDAVDVGDLVTPGENADTVRDGLYLEAPLLGDDGALAALDALLAQAEAAEAYPPGTTNLERHLTECLQAAEADANTQHRQMKFWKEQAKNAEDERDAAVRQATENGRLAQKHWDRAEAAERAAEQAQAALEFIARRRIALEAFGLKNIADVAERRAVLSAREEGADTR